MNQSQTLNLPHSLKLRRASKHQTSNIKPQTSNIKHFFMKHVFVFLIAMISALLLNAQSEKYVGAMKKNIAELDSAHDATHLSELANNFERIADAEKTQWLPYYYAAYCQVMNSF